jgi:DNA ligase-associated metallophosphoesterase
MVRFSFSGHELVALAAGALYWPARRALLVADLHFEKASWFAQFGQMLPPYDSLATLDALEALTERLAPPPAGARSPWDRGSCRPGTTAPPAQARLRALTGGCRWTWITGNHDAGFTTSCGGAVLEEAVVDGLVLRHEADPAESRPELSGHFHPKLRVTVRGRTIARRCFVATPTKLVLPAFGSLTGGLEPHHPEIVRAVGRGAEALVALEDRLLRFPVAA